MMVDCMSNRNLGILKNWMMLPGQAIANPSCEVEALAGQGCYMAQFGLASVMQMTENQYVCAYCGNQEFAISVATVVGWLLLFWTDLVQGRC